METSSGLYIGGDVGVIVAIHAELPLARPVCAVMAETAFSLDIRVGARHLAGHQQQFELAGLGWKCHRCESHNHCAFNPCRGTHVSKHAPR